MKIIFCTGLIRSGSTWSYNVSRLIGAALAEHLQMPFWCGYRDAQNLDSVLDELTGMGKPIVVIKTHWPSRRALEFMKHESVKNIYTIRDPRDCVASRHLKTKDSLDNSLNVIVKNLVLFFPFYQQCKNTLFVRYEEMMKDSQKYIRAIAEHLGVTLNGSLASSIDEQTGMENAKRIAESLSARSSDTLIHDRGHLVDPLTMLHDNHIQGGICGRWKQEFSNEQKRLLLNTLKSWLVILGYETDDSIDDQLSALDS
ncbi:MAG: sulfotransferase domain-containing protein [Thermodesulfovibrionales bacterium]|nr:sulfotransferase domain-containing protein [Thermodesulfovibrionales bacterium]